MINAMRKNKARLGEKKGAVLVGVVREVSSFWNRDLMKSRTRSLETQRKKQSRRRKERHRQGNELGLFEE